MLTGLVLFYVGAVLILNGLWLFGQISDREIGVINRLGLSWALWAALWLLFFVLLALQKPVTRLTAQMSIASGVLTGWLPGYLLLTGVVIA